MKNIKNFEKFEESLNEGLISWMKRKFNPKEMDSVIIDIIDHIKYEFDIHKLSEEIVYNRIAGNSYKYKYITNYDDTITVNESFLKINNNDITQYVDDFYIKKLYNFFNKKYRNIEDEKNKKNISKLKSELGRKYYKEEDDIF
jgi:hypothetical protein